MNSLDSTWKETKKINKKKDKLQKKICFQLIQITCLCKKIEKLCVSNSFVNTYVSSRRHQINYKN